MRTCKEKTKRPPACLTILIGKLFLNFTHFYTKDSKKHTDKSYVTTKRRDISLKLFIILALLSCGTDQDYHNENIIAKKPKCAIIMLKAEQCYAIHPDDELITSRSCLMLEHEYRHCELDPVYYFNKKGD